MKRRDFVRMFAEFQNISMDRETAEKLLAPGRMWDQLDFIKAALFQIDVSGFTPADDLDYFQGDRK